jgi:hypothetical protein
MLNFLFILSCGAAKNSYTNSPTKDTPFWLLQLPLKHEGTMQVYASKALISIYIFGFSKLISIICLIFYLFYLMVQQKIVIKVQLTCEKSRAKALKIAARTCGK